MSDPYVVANIFYGNLFEELDHHSRTHKYLTSDECKVLLGYYPKYRSVNAYYYRSLYARKIEAGLAFILGSKQRSHVLDAGCGVGSETLLFSVCGANVVGVDLREERIRVAKARVRYYEDKCHEKMNVDFVLSNIMEYFGDNKFDLIWTNEFISHVHPVEDFLEVAWENLKTGGWLVISDDNPANPYLRIKTWAVHRKFGQYTWVQDPRTTKHVPYAQEVLFLVANMTHLLERKGFRVCSVKYVNYMPRLPFSILRSLKLLESSIKEVPILKTMALNYAIVGKKIR